MLKRLWFKFRCYVNGYCIEHDQFTCQKCWELRKEKIREEAKKLRKQNA